MNKVIITFLILIFFTACSVNDAYTLTKAAINRNPSIALKSLAKSKAISYAKNPTNLSKDIKYLSTFMEKITKTWGKDNIRLPKKKEYVKYMQNYKSRALIDFDKGLVTVQTIDQKSYKDSLKNAIVTTLLLPDDPRSVDLYGSNKVKLGATPYLLGEIKDDQNKNIRYEWRANRYANILLKNRFKQKTIKDGSKDIKLYYVTIPMVKDHASIRVAKFKPIVKQYAKKFNVSENLIYAIIKTESNFNQFAVSNAGAYGLMQIVPNSAGKDAYRYLKNKNIQPSASYLFNAKNNIELGTAYIKILKTKYLKEIKNSVSKEYCVISAYNTGSGNVLKTFSSNKNKAATIINKKTPIDVYNTLRKKLPYIETRNYLKKVVTYKKEFINI